MCEPATSVSPPPVKAQSLTRAEALETEITELCAHINAASYRLLQLVAELDDEAPWGAWGLTSCAHWLNWRCGIGMNAAREKIRVAHALKPLPCISAAFASGELSFSKVRAVTRIADPENEKELLDLARYATAAQVEKLVRAYRRVGRLEERECATAQHASRELTYCHDDDGCLVIRARLPADEGAVVLQALNAAMDVQERDAESNDVSAVMLIRLSSVDTRCSVLACRCRTRSNLPKHSIPPNLYVNSRADLALRPIAKNFFSGFDIRTDLSVRGALLSVAGHSMAND